MLVHAPLSPASPLRVSLRLRRPATTFSEETLRHVLGLQDEDYSLEEVCGIMAYSERSMQRWMKNVRDNGTVWRNPVLLNFHEDAAVRNSALTHATLSLLHRETAAFLKDHSNVLVALSLDYPASDRGSTRSGRRRRSGRLQWRSTPSQGGA